MKKERPEVTLKFYASLRAKAGCSEDTCRAGSLRGVLDYLKKNYDGDFNCQLNSCSVFVNSENVAHLNGPATRLTQGDVLHLLPPTGGG